MEGGATSVSPRRLAFTVIPRIIHRVWLGGPEPEWTRPFAETWRRPGWEVRQWDEDSVAELFPLVNQRIFDDAETIAPDHVGQLRSDVLRYEILHRFGGVYVDTDLECLRPIDSLLDVDCFAAWEQEGRWVGNTILGCVPRHPFMGRLLDAIPGSVKRNAGRRPNRMTGPHLVTRLWRHDGEGVTVYGQRQFYPYDWSEVDQFAPGDQFSDAYTVHHWANKRRERAIPC